jgi:hypothetical protein
MRRGRKEVDEGGKSPYNNRKMEKYITLLLVLKQLDLLLSLLVVFFNINVVWFVLQLFLHSFAS